MTTTTSELRCYIACLACYNAGTLRGDWYDATMARDITPREIHGGRDTSHEELRILDLDGDCWPVNREMSPHEATEWAECMDEVDEHRRPALAAWVRSGSYTTQGDTDLPVVSDFEEAYCGEWIDFEEFAWSFIVDTGMQDTWPEEARSYFDFHSWTRDLAMDYSVESAPGGGVYVFRSL
ncbi:antirestriction protein ArdA [Gordonia sp. 852002-51296_SCH5728562-b]|uniref:antirestriction protein ArdA n=1 Tax=Gordonia sp. 852002-51296_SCH5728562-b TaxID=1834101 RepID=UPI0007EBA883|nr:antirestriction protein ArdA [Gordonia sp. 852002-51296_SCH5728562-b]OBA38979.1 hypothetical protein A5766_04285 [Gordonia sp. 852002-51296_SCH5728562-b]